MHTYFTYRQREGGEDGWIKDEEEEIPSHKNNYAGVDPVAVNIRRV